MRTLKWDRLEVKLFKYRDKISCVKTSDIVGILADGNESKIILKDGEVIKNDSTLKSALDYLKCEFIIRTHKSAAVNLGYVKFIDLKHRKIEFAEPDIHKKSSERLEVISRERCKQIKGALLNHLDLYITE